jgi:hypothetical protein
VDSYWNPLLILKRTAMVIASFVAALLVYMACWAVYRPSEIPYDYTHVQHIQRLIAAGDLKPDADHVYHLTGKAEDWCADGVAYATENPDGFRALFLPTYNYMGTTRGYAFITHWSTGSRQIMDNGQMVLINSASKDGRSLEPPGVWPFHVVKQVTPFEYYVKFTDMR